MTLPKEVGGKELLFKELLPHIPCKADQSRTKKKHGGGFEDEACLEIIHCEPVGFGEPNLTDWKGTDDP